ncbi:amino acid ABC transporter ATP-binding protein [Enterococcus villorum]|uniref:Amino acid ABC transporter ATP-binding protein n=1 Tax=Enterococcus villorum TaxID=112904 RepID=A0A1V8YCJ1_9ENTE|nr:YxeA family protein [Enterococcus villorum]OQO70341.1 amino acid ABC transporter ATP-binding protein [Enterococcus villorum]OQO77204.1 amino acid ABC transporter ATP-binding protein [Enterococcus villorum]
MRKFLLGIVISSMGIGIFLIGGLRIAEKMIMGGDSYYVQITNDGEKDVTKDNHNEVVVHYKYTLPGYDDTGSEKILEFVGQQPRPLRKGAYLKVTWNKRKGVTSYEEVKQREIPKLAKEKLAKGR